MNRVIIMREAITKIVAMLALKNVRVTQRGTRAYVEYNSKGIPTHVNVPYIPDDASDELLDAIQGFVDHEVGHILHTDYDVLAEAKKLKVAKLHNVIEDAFIEKKQAYVFAGCGVNLANVSRFFLKNYTDKELAAHPEMKDGLLIVPAIRAWSGQTVFKDYMRDKWEMIEDITKKLEHLIPEFEKVASSRDGLNLALKVRDALTPKKPEKPKEKDKEPGKGDDGDGDGESESSGKSKKDAKGEPKKSDKPADKSAEKEESDEPTDPDAETSDAEDGDTSKAGSDGAAELTGEDPDEHDPEGDDGSEDAPGSSDDGEDKDDAGDDGEDEDDAGDEEGESGDSEGDKGDGDMDGGPEMPADSPDSAEESPSAPASKDKSEKGDSPVEAGETPSEPPGPTLEEIERSIPEDFDEEVAKLIGEAAVEAARESDYLIYTKDLDVVEKLSVPPDWDDGLKDMTDSVDHMVGPLQKDIERAVAAKSAVTWVSGYRSGRLNTSSLSRLAVGDDRVFKRKQVNASKDVAISILIDASASMHSADRIRTATYAAYGLSAVLDRLNVTHEVLCFTTAGSCFDRTGMGEEIAAVKRRYARNEAIYMPIIKSFGERINSEVKKRFAYVPDELGLSQNVDGECVQVAAARLALRRETRKILMVLSDGAPCCPGDVRAQHHHLIRVVKGLTKDKIECIGIGIQTDSVRKYYPKSVVLNNLADLPGATMKEIKKILVG